MLGEQMQEVAADEKRDPWANEAESEDRSGNVLDLLGIFISKPKALPTFDSIFEICFGLSFVRALDLKINI